MTEERHSKQVMITNSFFGTVMTLSCVVCLGLSYVTARYSRLYTDVSILTFLLCSVFFGIILQLVSFGIKMVFFHDEIRTLQAEISTPSYWNELLYHGLLLGVLSVLSGCTNLAAMITETTGQTSFIIGMYVIFVPITESALHLFAKCPPHRTWLSTVLVFVGVFFLSDCATENCFADYGHIGVLYAFLCMLVVVTQIIETSRAVEVVGASTVVFASYCFAFVILLILVLAFETEFYTSSGWNKIYSALNVIILNAMADYFTALFMTIGLVYLTPERATILLSLDSLSGAFFGWVILGEAFYGLEYLGGCLMLVAVGFELFLTDDLTCDIKKIEGDCDQDNQSTLEAVNERTLLLSA